TPNPRGATSWPRSTISTRICKCGAHAPAASERHHMSRACFSMSRVILASPGQVFHLLDDYQSGHWRVLPPAFSDYRVLEGGFGEGTRITFSLTTGGRKRSTEAVITVPEPGR